MPDRPAVLLVSENTTASQPARTLLEQQRHTVRAVGDPAQMLTLLAETRRAFLHLVCNQWTRDTCAGIMQS
jgi:hypothetical protein